MVDRFAHDWREAGLDAATEALLVFAEALTRDPSGDTAERVARLRRAGWSDRAIHDATQICAYFNYINRIAEGLGVEPEDWIDDVGRPR